MPPTKLIIDTDPGIDDILALLLAFSAAPEDVEVLLLSLTFGNIDVQNCLRNAISLFHVVERELEWRKSTGESLGFAALRAAKPLIAVGATKPLVDPLVMADYYRLSESR
jgi:hypothetical protein